MSTINEVKEEPLENDTDGNSLAASSNSAAAYKQRMRYNSTKTPAFEGIDEENEELSSNSSTDDFHKLVKKEKVDPTDQVDDKEPQSNKHEKPEKDEDVQEESKEDEAERVKSNESKTESSRGQQRVSESSCEEVDLNQRSILKSANRNRPVLGRHLSFESQHPTAEQVGMGSHPNISTKNEEDKEAVDKYYERNNFTITGIYEKNQDTFRNLPDYLRREQNRRLSISQRSKCSYAKPEPTSGEQAQKRFRKSFYFLLHNRKRMGFRHIVLLLIVLAYTLLGAAVFLAFESKNERENFVAVKAFLDATITQMASEMTVKVNDPLIAVNESSMEEYLRSAYKKLLTLESKYEGSALYKAEDPENNMAWTFASSFFFSMNVYTTTGYGSIAPVTNEGKVCAIIYGFIFVPMTLVVLRDLGQLLLVYFTKIYAIILFKLRTARGYSEAKEDEVISLPIKFSLAILAAYLMFCTLFVFELDALSGPPGSGISFFNSFYFSFISLTTIGFGDIMPNNATFHPIVSIIFFFGLPIAKVVNRLTYVSFENGVFATMTVMENRLDQCLGNVPQLQLDPERGVISRAPSIQMQTSVSRKSTAGSLGGDDAHSHDEDEIPNEWVNNFTIRSIATFMRSNGDVYGGGFGKVNLRRTDILPTNSQDTVRSSIR